MVKEVLVGEIVKAVRLPVSGGVAPARLEIAVGGLKGLSHTLLVLCVKTNAPYLIK